MWITEKSVSYDLIREKAIQLRDDVNLLVSADNTLVVELSNCWHETFCARYYFKVHQQYGENGSVDEQMLVTDIPNYSKFSVSSPKIIS